MIEETKLVFVMGRAHESGRLWVYPLPVWEEVQKGEKGGHSMFEEVARGDDYESLLQMAALNNKELNNELFADRDQK